MRILSIISLLIPILMGSPGIESPLTVRRKLTQMVSQALGPGVQVQMENIRVLPLPPVGAVYSIQNPNPPLGLVSFSVKWEENGRLVTRFGSAVVRAQAKVARARIPIKHGDGFNQLNVEFETHELQNLQQSGYYQNWNGLLSHKAVGYLRPGQVITTSHVSPIFLVERNQWVELKRSRGEMTLTAQVKALETGTLNQWIRVENPKSKRVLQAKVIGNSSVEIP